MSLLDNIQQAFRNPVITKIGSVKRAISNVELQIAKGVTRETSKGLNIVSQGIDDFYGLPGRVATGFNKSVPTGFSQQVSGALRASGVNKYVAGGAGFAASFAEPVGLPAKAGKVLTKIPALTRDAGKVLREPVIKPITSGLGRELQAVKSGLSQALKNTLRPPAPKLRPPQVSQSTGGGFSKPPRVPSSLGSSVPQPFDPGKYVKEQVAAREVARNTGKLNLGGKAKSFLANAKAKLVDFAAPIEDTLNAAVKKAGIKLKPSEDIHNQIDRVLRAPTIAGQFVKDHGLADVIKTVDNPDALDQYMIAKHAMELENKGIATGRNLQHDQALVAAYGLKYEGLANKVSEYSRKLLQNSTDSGLISKELAAKLVQEYPDYVPFQRVFEETEQAVSGTGKAVASLSRQTVVQRMTGSTREIESPLQSLLAKTNDVFKQGEKNVAAKMLAGYEKLPGNPFQLRRLADGEAAAHTISYIEDGVKHTYETTPEIAQAAKALNVQQMNVLGKILAFPVRVARLGLTGINLPFIATNVARDQVTAFINADKSLSTSVANVPNFTRALFSAVKHDELYKELVRSGGAGTSYDLSRSAVEETFGKIRASRSVSSNILYKVTHPGDLLRAAEDIVGRAEELTRLQQFRGTRQALLRGGMDEKNATIAAARAARENTVNFARRGEWGTVLNSVFLYLNAGIQGTRTLLRNLKVKPVATSAKIVATTLFPVASVTAWNMSDPERRAAYADIADYEKENNIIIIPPHPTKDEKGSWNVIKIPLSQEIRYLAGAARRPIEAAAGLDPLKFKDFASALLGTVSPINPLERGAMSQVVPQALKPSIESAVNRNLFTGNPLVPQGMENLSPENQVKSYTSGTARKIGSLGNVSPIKVEEFIKATFGGVGSQILNASDQALNKAGKIPAEQIGGTSITEGITKRFSKARGGKEEQKAYDTMDAAARKKADYKATTIKPIYDNVQLLRTQGKEAEAQQIVEDLSVSDYEIYKSIRTAEKTKNTTALERQLLPTYEEIQRLKESGAEDAAQEMVEALTEEEYHAYTLLKKKIQDPTPTAPLTDLLKAPQKQSFLGTNKAQAAETYQPFVPHTSIGDVVREIPGTLNRGLKSVQNFMEGMGPKTVGEAKKQAAIPIGISDEAWRKLPDNSPIPKGVRFLDPTGAVGGLKRAEGKIASEVAPKVFQGFKDLTTKLLEKLKGKSTVSKQYISDLTNSPDLKQTEKDLIRRVLNEGDDASPLTQEARKYRTAEEFVKAQEQAYHGSPVPLKSFSNKKGGVFFTNSMEDASGFGGNPDNVYEGYLAFKKPLVINAKGAKWDELNTKYGKSTQEVISNAQKDGYDGIVFKNIVDNAMDTAEVGGQSTISYAYKPRDAFLNESQLTDLHAQSAKSDQISVPDFAEKVRAELLPLKRMSLSKTKGDDMGFSSTKYESVNLPDELRGPVANYDEHIYRSPVKTSAGQVHFGDTDPGDYFGHTRVEDLPDKAPTVSRTDFEVVDDKYGKTIRNKKTGEEMGSALSSYEVDDFFEGVGVQGLRQDLAAGKSSTRRVIEVQSDLFQKGRLENSVAPSQQEIDAVNDYYGLKGKDKYTSEKLPPQSDLRDMAKYGLEGGAREQAGLRAGNKDLARLEPYKNNAAHFRMIREEVKQAAVDGKTKLQFPTGETAMKIEGLGQANAAPWKFVEDGKIGEEVSPENLEVGKTIAVARADNANWIITDVLGDGKFKAVNKGVFDSIPNAKVTDNWGADAETFDISGKVDTENPIYKFYEKDVGKYLKSKYNAQLITDPQGVKWWEVNVDPKYKHSPVEALAAAPLFMKDRKKKEK